MIALVNNILDVEKIEEGKMEFKFANIDIARLVQDMVVDYKVLAMHRDLELSFASSAPSLMIKADGEKIRQVLQNLIDNALKYTEKGFVRVSVREEIITPQPQHTDKLENIGMSRGEQIVQEPAPQHSNILQNVGMNSVLITVTDSGRGLSKELIAKFFQRFVRDEQTAREVQDILQLCSG